jgi:hypothetical protein
MGGECYLEVKTWFCIFSLMKTIFKAGVYTQQIEYKSFSPSPINKPFEWQDQKINVLLGEAMRLLGELNAYVALFEK